MTRAEYERNARRLIGQTISAVVYYEIDYKDDAFHFFDDTRFDSLDFGLELQLRSGRYVSITWGSEFHQYGVSLVDGRIFRPVTMSRCLDVSQTMRWSSLLGRRVASVDVFWSWFDESGQPETRIYTPQDVLLRFAGDFVLVISSLEITNGHRARGMTDHITLFDDLQMARRFNCLVEE